MEVYTVQPGITWGELAWDKPGLAQRFKHDAFIKIDPSECHYSYLAFVCIISELCHVNQWYYSLVIDLIG